ncbi:MAG: ArsR family transcriptional regulator [Methanomicrobiales archaeon HGW-Methanomicrobiales-4]|nr:MAG: ArsR family transcriptional regulator [Methanomicrobiales archaeon HGW-Methanomicrobiales-4]
MLVTDEPAELSRLLDILGNRNRRRIIDLIRDKPCFVTEISERLMVSPKAVIDHLQMLEEASILSFRHDDKRRKYYYLAHDINIQVHLNTQQQGLIPLVLNEDQKFIISLLKLWQMISSRQELSLRLEELEREIDQQIGEVLRQGRQAGSDDTGLMIAVALAHGARTVQEIAHMTDLENSVVQEAIENLVEQGIACRTGSSYRLRGNNAEQSL